jgi:hypothetical protein
MEMLKTNISIATSQRHQWYPCVTYNSIDKEYMAVWWESGPMNDTDTISYHSVNGQRISPDGKPIGNPFEIDPPEQGWKTLTAPFLAHDSFTNEYMVAFTTGAGYMPQHLNVARINNTGALQFSDMVYQSPYNVNHPAVVFNSVRKQYLTINSDKYWDKTDGTTNDIIGYILDENGKTVKGPIAICKQTGIQFNPKVTYNPQEDQYFAVWGDFRHVSGYDKPGEVYGALIDGDGNVIRDITLHDDFSQDNPEENAYQGDPNVFYNPDKNEYLAVWNSSGPGLDGIAIVGRIVAPDGKFKSKEFTIVDAPGYQGLAVAIYVQKRKEYFLVFMDGRDADPKSEQTWQNIEKDIYAIWLRDNGKPRFNSQLIPVCVAEGDQAFPRLAYDEDKERFLILYREAITNDFAPVANMRGPVNQAAESFTDINPILLPGHTVETQGDIRAALYGVR